MGEKEKKARGDVSLDDVRDMLWQALEKRIEKAYLNEVYGSYIVYGKDSKFYRLPYSLLEGEVQFGSEAIEVERVWVETRSQQEETDEGLEMLLRLDRPSDPEGSAWDVTICEPGFTKNGWYLPEDALRDAESLFEGVGVNLYELPEATHVPNPLFELKDLLAKNKVGWIDKVRYVAGEGLKGVLHFLDSAKDLGKNMLAASEAGQRIYGLSYDAAVRAKKDVVEGKSVFRLLEFLVADSVDIVTRPAAGGKFNRALASRQAQTRREIMDKKALWEMIKELRPGLLDGKEFDSTTEEDVVGLARMAMAPPEKEKTSKKKEEPAGAGGGPAGVSPEEFQLFRCEMALERTLTKAALPEKWEKKVQDRFGGKVFEMGDLERAVADIQDVLTDTQRVAEEKDNPPMAGSDIHVGIGTIERAQMAVDRTFGLNKDDVEGLCRMETLDHQPFFVERVANEGGHRMRSVQDLDGYDQVPAFRGIREMYAFFTGDPEISGFFNRKRLPADLRASADITSATFTYVLGNTLGRRLVKEYKAPDYLERLLLSVIKPVKDFRTQEAVKIGGFPDLATVDPETADYEEIEAITDEEITYVLAQKGNLLTITRKTIINDDISIVQRVISKLGRAARRTHGKYVWGKYIDNDTCVDGTAVFTSGHGNLGATALGHATALVAWKGLANMTEKDSGAYLGLLDGQDIMVNLIGPTALKELVGRIEKEEFYYSTNDLTDKLPNSLYGQVKGHTLSLLNADANDWYMLLPATIVDLIEMGYLNGRQEPEFFVADTPSSEQVFVADKIRHKVRHEYSGAPIDYTGAYKGVVT